MSDLVQPHGQSSRHKITTVGFSNSKLKIATPPTPPSTLCASIDAETVTQALESPVHENRVWNTEVLQWGKDLCDTDLEVQLNYTEVLCTKQTFFSLFSTCSLPFLPGLLRRSPLAVPSLSKKETIRKQNVFCQQPE